MGGDSVGDGPVVSLVLLELEPTPPATVELPLFGPLGSLGFMGLVCSSLTAALAIVSADYAWRRKEARRRLGLIGGLLGAGLWVYLAVAWVVELVT